MILTKEQVRACLRGTVDIIEQNGHLVPLRFGKYVRESVYGEGNRFHGATLHASGVTLDLVTDASSFSFTYAVNPGGTGHSFDLFLDGVMVTHAPCAKACDTLSLSLPEGEHRVTIYLPAHGPAGGLAEVELADGATLTRHKFDRKFLFIGDSITQGWKSELDTQAYT